MSKAKKSFPPLWPPSCGKPPVVVRIGNLKITIEEIEKELGHEPVKVGSKITV